ncbi:MAG: DUF2178 domain-containing protein [Caulobacterales bacterium]|nr:DUF2178 domain-containing protein [Caulobacterales bacterium]MCA0372417.1 DUF2178 domain-containing protein [Pseudomonadota bacterium]
MAYKEKIAWLYLIGMVGCFGTYFVFLIMNPAFYMWNFLDQFKPLAILGILNAIIVGIGHFWLMKTNEKADRLATDERDIIIEAKATKISYSVLIYAMLFVGGVLPFTESKWKIVNCTILAVCIAEITRNSSTIISYKRQSS